jgi:hypothetical protein
LPTVSSSSLALSLSISLSTLSVPVAMAGRGELELLLLVAVRMQRPYMAKAGCGQALGPSLARVSPLNGRPPFPSIVVRKEEGRDPVLEYETTQGSRCEGKTKCLWAVA